MRARRQEGDGRAKTRHLDRTARRVYEGRTTAEIQLEAPGWTIWNGEVPGGETAVEVGYRADRVIRQVTEGE